MAKLLLVEDDNNLREIYQARLSAEGYDIFTAENGETALSVAKEHRPDLIISDVMMPRISGLEMLDILRNTPELRDTKVIMLTALGQAEDQARAGKLGADKYLVKSQVTLEDIVNCAQELLVGEVTQPAPTEATTPAENTPVAVQPETEPVATPETKPSAVVTEAITTPELGAIPAPQPVTTQGAIQSISPPVDTTTSSPTAVSIVPVTDPDPLATPSPAMVDSTDTATDAATAEVESAVTSSPAISEAAVATPIEPTEIKPEAPNIPTAIDPVSAVSSDAVTPPTVVPDSPTTQMPTVEGVAPETQATTPVGNSSDTIISPAETTPIPGADAAALSPPLDPTTPNPVATDPPFAEPPVIPTVDPALTAASPVIEADTVPTTPSAITTLPDDTTAPQVVAPVETDLSAGATVVTTATDTPQLPDPNEDTEVANDNILQDALDVLTTEPTTPTVLTPPSEKSSSSEAVEPSQFDQEAAEPSSPTTPDITTPTSDTPVELEPESQQKPTTQGTTSPTVAEESGTQPDTDNVTVAGKKVIKPLNNIDNKPSLNDLLAKEVEKEQSDTSDEPAIISSDDASQAVPPHTNDKVYEDPSEDPNSISL